MNKWLACFLMGWMAGGISGAFSADSGFFPSGDAAWTVDIERMKQPGNKPDPVVPYPVKYDIQKKGDVRLDRITFSNGQTTERWWSVGASTFLWEKGLNGNAYFYSPNENTAATSFDAAMFRWLNGKKPLGEEKWKGKTCLVFSGEAQEEHRKAARKAWIDKETGRVMGLQASGLTYVFTFHDEVPERLEPPPTLLKRADRARRLIGN